MKTPCHRPNIRVARSGLWDPAWVCCQFSWILSEDTVRGRLHGEFQLVLNWLHFNSASWTNRLNNKFAITWGDFHPSSWNATGWKFQSCKTGEKPHMSYWSHSNFSPFCKVSLVMLSGSVFNETRWRPRGSSRIKEIKTVLYRIRCLANFKFDHPNHRTFRRTSLTIPKSWKLQAGKRLNRVRSDAPISTSRILDAIFISVYLFPQSQIVAEKKGKNVSPPSRLKFAM